MRLEKEESKRRTIVALKANYIVQDYNMYAPTRNTDSLRSMAVLLSRAQERRSREIRARSARERAAKPREK